MTAIYLDHQATSPIDPRVLDAMMPWFSRPANPHAAHAFGRDAASAVDRAREQIASLVGARVEDVVLTSGATEAANIALRSLPAGARVVATSIEHPCVRETLLSMAGRLDVTILPVGSDGLLDADEIADMFDQVDAAIVMAVNNEIGTVQPMAEIAGACRLTGTSLMTDVTQAAGRISVDLGAWNARAAWLSSHKIYGPQGIGALIWRGGDTPTAITTGGGQERGLRPGTVPTALAVGFGAACEIAAREMDADAAHARALAEAMLARIRALTPDVVVNGSMRDRVPHNLNLAFPGVDADALVGSLPDVAISTGSACSAGALGTSHVLEAIGAGELAASSIRVGFGRATSMDEVLRAAALICEAADRLTDDAPGRAGGRA